jgi:hypothetical protein
VLGESAKVSSLQAGNEKTDNRKEREDSQRNAKKLFANPCATFLPLWLSHSSLGAFHG